jgi:hypothetical protein
MSPGKHWIEDWVEPTAGLDVAVEKRKVSVLPIIEPRPSSLQPVIMVTEILRIIRIINT